MALAASWLASCISLRATYSRARSTPVPLMSTVGTSIRVTNTVTAPLQSRFNR